MCSVRHGVQLLSPHAACLLTGQSRTLWCPVRSAAVAAPGAWPRPWKTLRDSLLWGQSFVLVFPGLCLSGITSCTETPVLSPLPPGGRAQLPSTEHFCFLQPNNHFLPAQACWWEEGSTLVRCVCTWPPLDSMLLEVTGHTGEAITIGHKSCICQPGPHLLTLVSFSHCSRKNPTWSGV